MFTLKQACTYLPTGMPCTIQAVFPDRHRARIVLENSQELDEVAWHDLAAQVAPIPTTVVPAVTVAAPLAVAAAEAEEDEDAEPDAAAAEARWYRGQDQHSR